MSLSVGSFFFPFDSFSLSSNPHSPSLVYGFPGFLSFFGSFSSLWFIPFSLFLFYFSVSPPFSPLPPLLRAGVGAVFIV
jgi:hypothetical protein